MGEHTGIEWTDATWNPIGGCSIASPGCTNCYAQRLAGTRLQHLPLYAGTTTDSKAGPVFNGHMTVADDDAAVWTWPLRWRGSKTPRRGAGARSMIFVGDMSDLFHRNRPRHVIDRVFAVMAMAGRHDFQVLTKRPDVIRRSKHLATGLGLRRVGTVVPCGKRFRPAIYGTPLTRCARSGSHATTVLSARARTNKLTARNGSSLSGH